jgi:hypothetical protein
MIRVGESKETAIVKEQLLRLLDNNVSVTSRTRSRAFLGSGKEVVLKYSKKHGPKGTRYWFGIVPNELESVSPEKAFIVLALGSEKDLVVWPFSVASKVLRPELRSPDGQWKINVERRADSTTLLIGGEKVRLDEYTGALDLLGFGVPKRGKCGSSPTIPAILAGEQPDHNTIRDMIKEIGELEKYFSETEYHFDHMILDAVWRKTRTSYPAVAFEVQIGGNYYEALSKLKHSWDKFNSKPVLVTTEKFEKKVDDLLDGSFHEIREQIRIVNWRRIEELYLATRKLTSLRSELQL